MTWRYELRKDDVLKNADEFLQNPEGTASVRGWWSKSWRFEYTRKDLGVRFYASRIHKSGEPYSEREPSLGPECIVFFDKKNLSHLLANEDHPLVVADIKSALKSQWQFVTAAPPPVEQVAFRNKELERFGDFIFVWSGN